MFVCRCKRRLETLAVILLILVAILEIKKIEIRRTHSLFGVPVGGYEYVTEIIILGLWVLVWVCAYLVLFLPTDDGSKDF